MDRPSPFAQGAMLGVFLVLTIGLGSMGSLLSGSGDTQWYLELRKPALNPPGWLFGVVWPILFVLMGVAVWLVWRAKDAAGRARALFLFWLQYAFNFAWSFLFFAFQQIGLAAIHIAIFIGVLVLTMRAFKPINTAAFWLLAPYLTWISFAFYLNVHIWFLNA